LAPDQVMSNTSFMLRTFLCFTAPEFQEAVEIKWPLMGCQSVVRIFPFQLRSIKILLLINFTSFLIQENIFLT